MTLETCVIRTIFIPVLERSIAMPVKELSGRRTQRRNEFGKVSSAEKLPSSLRALNSVFPSRRSQA